MKFRKKEINLKPTWIIIVLFIMFVFNSAIFSLTVNANNEIETGSMQNLRMNLLNIKIAQYAMLASERSLMCGELNYAVLRNIEYKQLRENKALINHYVKDSKETIIHFFGIDKWEELNSEIENFLYFNDFVLKSSIKLELNKMEDFLTDEQKQDLISAVLQSSLMSQESISKISKIIEKLLNPS